MSSLKEDPTRHTLFSQIAAYATHTSNLPLTVLEWRSDIPFETHRLSSVTELIDRPPSDFQIIFAPLDLPNQETSNGHLALFKHFGVPSAFLSERIQSVTHSFGNRKEETGKECIWFHFLCKNIVVGRDENDELKIVNQNELTELWNVRPRANNLSQGDYSWIRSGFILVTEHTAQNTGTSPKTTLLCLGASTSTIQRLQTLTENAPWEQILLDPYILLDIVCEELYLQLDNVAWKLGEVFGETEGKILHRASQPGSTADRIDFVGLHNIAKHVIYMREGVDAALQTMEKLVSHHRRRENPNRSTDKGIEERTREELLYTQTLFQSTGLRLRSLEKRMANLINLSFNLVTQQDSRIMQGDSSSMKIIAILALLFLPSGTVAAIFGSQFFNLIVDEEGRERFSVSGLFWVFWAVALPLTLVIMGLWSWWYSTSKSRLFNEKTPPKRSNAGATDVNGVRV